MLSDILQCNTVLYCYRFVTLHSWLCFQHSLVFHVSSSGRRWTCDVSCGSCSESTFDCVSRGMIFAYGCIVYCVCDADVSVDVLWRSALMTSTRRAATINNLVWQTNRRRVGRGMGRVSPPIQLGGLGSVVSSPSGSAAEPRRKTNSVHSDTLRRPLVAKIHKAL